jgi:hypothetical protein
MRILRHSAVGHTLSRCRAACLALTAVTLGATCSASWAAPTGSGDVLARSIALYPTLKSYADTGTVVIEGPGTVERSKFKTYFRQGDSLDFLFDYQGVAREGAGGSLPMSFHRIVLWMLAGELQTFSQQQRSHETIPRESGRQVAAMHGTSVATAGASILIPSLIFSQAKLPGAIFQIQQPMKDAGFEAVNGRRCHKIIGMAAEYYPSGQMTNVRQVTVWVDAETLLVRKVFEDTPKGWAIGSYLRKTVTIEPRANPKLEDSQFQFTVPTFQQ